MKIALYAEHGGLIKMLVDLWQDHDVRLYPRWDKYTKNVQGDEDVAVVTLPYKPEWTQNGKPTIIYYTDPLIKGLIENRELIDRLSDDKKLTVIGGEDCYPKEWNARNIQKNIPFSVYPPYYPPYTGWKPVVAVVNRQAEKRWGDCVRGVEGRIIPLDEYLEGIPYEIINIDDDNQFKKAYADYRCLFYFSNSPYTIVLFEAMTAGMPIVAYNHCQTGRSKVIEKYLNVFSTDREEIRSTLQLLLEERQRKQIYPITPFEEVRKMWNELFQEVVK